MSSLRIQTPRLLLRPVEKADAAPTAALVTPDVSENLSTWPSPTSAPEVLARIATSKQLLAERRGIDFAMLLRPHGRLVGWTGFLKETDDEARIGYWIGTQFRQQGLTTEAVRHAIPAAAAFLQISSVRALVLPENTDSVAILRSVGFVAGGKQWFFRATQDRTDLFDVYRLEPALKPRC